MEGFLFQATVYLVAAVVAVPLAARLGLGSVLGYLAAGVLIGPVLGLVGTETEGLQHFAEFGVVMMLFLIGLELEPRTLWAMRHRLVGLGGAQVLVTGGLIAGAAMALGEPLPSAVAIGMIFSLSSTAIVLQTLSEKGLMQTEGGRSSFAVLLTQDIAVIPMLATMPLLAVKNAGDGSGDGRGGDAHGGPGSDSHGGGAGGHAGEPAAPVDPTAEAHAEAAVSLVQNLPAWGVTLLTAGAVVGIILMGVYATRPVFAFVHRARLRELNTALALLIVIGIAFVMTTLGLSPALGTFLAGVVLANSEFRHELESDIAPFKGLLLGLFFITVGAGIAFDAFFGSPWRFVALTLLLMAIKGLVLWALAVIFRLRTRDRWLFTLGLAQAGEFGFVLTSFALQTDVLPRDLGEELLLIIALSMLLTPAFFILWEQLRKRMSEPEPEAAEHDEIDEKGSVIIAGIGRFGQVVNRLVQVGGFQTVVLDHDLETIQLMRKFGFKGFFGDPSRPELLHAAGLETAKVLVVAMDDREAVTRLVAFARRERPDIRIVARARDRVHVYELFQAGANDIVREMFDSSLRAGRYVLENMGMSDHAARRLEREFFRMDRAALRDLAELWEPGVPVSRNEPYIARARELNKELETELVAKLDEAKQAPAAD